MSKTYILEPTEFEFERKAGDYGGYLSCNDASIISPIYSNITVGMIVDFNNGDKFIVATKHEYDGIPVFQATRDGKDVSSPNAEYASFSISEVSKLTVKTNKTTKAGIYTVSIYTETEEPGGLPGLEDKNVVYEYQLAANNNIKDILMAVIEAIEQNGDSAVNIPGYSVMELLVENLLVYHDITGDKLTTFRGTSFANDVEKIAWIIRNQ